jgi:hypothetical protein
LIKNPRATPIHNIATAPSSAITIPAPRPACFAPALMLGGLVVGEALVVDATVTGRVVALADEAPPSVSVLARVAPLLVVEPIVEFPMEVVITTAAEVVLAAEPDEVAVAVAVAL